MTDWSKKSEPVEGVETYVICRDGEPYIATGDERLERDGKLHYEMKKGQPVTGTHDQCFAMLLRLQSASTFHAMKYEGWAILPYENKEQSDGDGQP